MIDDENDWILGIGTVIVPVLVGDGKLLEVLQETECDVLEEEEDDDPIFVLTDEWREFFARSEAKRKLVINTLSSFKVVRGNEKYFDKREGFQKMLQN
ncbi:unnamed protein product [Dovyalis caffra]|uniref:Uncharacterized protein n=1 Tax=Dovyalis caffra TaxID=77055 RepID=A0AAV1SFX6_9ROSI|nr:unnamed protein product [Dovyalis caffra]